jgi:thioredoxin reductase (NADPH)
MKHYDIIIVGGGPAGMTAALYSLRAGKSVLILEKENFGGQIANSPRVENIPSIKEISGLDYSNNLFEQILDLGAEFELEEVTSLNKENDEFIVTTNYATYTSKAVIIATGVSHRHIGVHREDELFGKGISYCAVCDGAFYKDKEVAVIGDGNTALQYSILLTNYCKKVYVCTLFDKFFGDSILVDILKKKANVEIIQNISLRELVGEESVTGLNFTNTVTNESISINVEGVFIAIGQVPHNEIFSSLVELDKGYIVVNENKETKTEGLYAVGDCTKKEIRQLTTATSDGSVAAINACRYLEK